MSQADKRMEWVKQVKGTKRAYFCLPRRLDDAVRLYCELKGLTMRQWLTSFLLKHLNSDEWFEMRTLVEDCEKHTKGAQQR